MLSSGQQESPPQPEPQEQSASPQPHALLPHPQLSPHPHFCSSSPMSSTSLFFGFSRALSRISVSLRVSGFERPVIVVDEAACHATFSLPYLRIGKEKLDQKKCPRVAGLRNIVEPRKRFGASPATPLPLAVASVRLMPLTTFGTEPFSRKALYTSLSKLSN